MPRNILIMTLGETAAVVTETVDSLLTREPPWVPEEIHIVTHTGGKELCERVLSGADSELHKLFEARGYPPVEPATHVPMVSGLEVKDIISELDNIAFGNTLTRLIKTFADDTDTRLHVSLSGGRKTMSAYAALAMSLFGRNLDELTHVLVHPLDIQERVRNFYWRGQDSQRLTDAQGTPVLDPQGKPLLAQNAAITLASVPFVRIKPILKERPFPGGEIDYAEIVAFAQAAINVHDVHLDCSSRTVTVGHYAVRLGQAEFALYRLLAIAVQRQWRGAGPGGIGPEHVGWLTFSQILDPNESALSLFFEYLDDAYPVGVEKVEDITVFIRTQLAAATNASTQQKRRQALNAAKRRFTDFKKNLSDKLETSIPDPTLRALASIETRKSGTVWRFGLTLAPQHIHITLRT